MTLSTFIPALRGSALSIAAAAAFAAGMTISTQAGAEGRAERVEATFQDIEQTLGSVPGFLRQFPAAALPGAWTELKDVQFSEDTALPLKTKALISLAVAAQIPCHYCVWLDTNTARRAGASSEEIGEAVAMAAITRHWSALFNGLQIDFETFKQDLGGEFTETE